MVLDPKTPAEILARDVAISSWISVDIFFILSGFLITTLLLQAKQTPHYFRNFYARRALRIVPLYYLLLVGCFFILPLFSHEKIQATGFVLDHKAWYWGFLSNIFIALRGAWSHPVLDVSWTLAIEEQFYLIWPIPVLLLGTKNLKRLCVGGFGLVFLTRFLLLSQDANPWSIFVATPTRMDSLFGGSFLAVFLATTPITETIKRRVRLALPAVFLVMVGMMINGGWFQIDPTMQKYGYTVVSAFVFFLLAHVILSEPDTLLNRFFSSKFMRFFGKYSYGIYLTHLPLRSIVRDYVFKPETFASFGHVLIGQALFYVVAAIPGILAGFLSYHLFEKHFLKLKDRFASEPVADQKIPDNVVSLPTERLKRTVGRR